MRKGTRYVSVTILSVLIGLASAAALCAQADPLPSWNDTAPKKAIVAFVEKVTQRRLAGFRARARAHRHVRQRRHALGRAAHLLPTLLRLDRVKALAPQHPEWKTKEPFASVLKGDMKGVAGRGEKGVDRDDGRDSHRHDHRGVQRDGEGLDRDGEASEDGRPYTEMVYQPMLELLAYLRANGFKTFIVSGGGIEFMRPWTERVYGIPPEQVVGSSGKLKLEMRDGKPVLVKLPDIDLIDDKEGKPVGIQSHIGRRPIAAFGNSDGDLQMLQWTTAGSGPRFALIVHHTDAEREWAYDRNSHIGRLDKALDEATARGWVVVDMKRSWKVIYPSQK